jgi:hypothetical protein
MRWIGDKGLGECSMIGSPGQNSQSAGIQHQNDPAVETCPSRSASDPNECPLSGKISMVAFGASGTTPLPSERV